MSNTDAIELNLLDNGIDFISEGVGRLCSKKNPNARDCKYSLLHTYSGLLLVLKERLRLADEKQIWTKQIPGNGHTVDFKLLLERLRTAANYNPSKADTKLLDESKDHRNRIEHYQVELVVADTKLRLLRLIEFIGRFMRDELKINLSQTVSSRARRYLLKMEAFAIEHAADWRRRASKYDRLSLPKLQRLAEREPYHPKHNPCGDDLLLECTACSTYSVVTAPNDADIGLCTNVDCREPSLLARCEHCGTQCTGMLCEPCAEHFQKQCEAD